MSICSLPVASILKWVSNPFSSSFKLICKLQLYTCSIITHYLSFALVIRKGKAGRGMGVGEVGAVRETDNFLSILCGLHCLFFSPGWSLSWCFKIQWWLCCSLMDTGSEIRERMTKKDRILLIRSEPHI